MFLIVARGSSVIPKSVTPSRIEENMKLIKLDSGDVKALDNIAKTHPPNRFVYPAFGVSFLPSVRVLAVADSVLRRSTSDSPTSNKSREDSDEPDDGEEWRIASRASDKRLWMSPKPVMKDIVTIIAMNN